MPLLFTPNKRKTDALDIVSPTGKRRSPPSSPAAPGPLSKQPLRFDKPLFFDGLDDDSSDARDSVEGELFESSCSSSEAGASGSSCPELESSQPLGHLTCRPVTVTSETSGPAAAASPLRGPCLGLPAHVMQQILHYVPFGPARLVCKGWNRMRTLGSVIEAGKSSALTSEQLVARSEALFKYARTLSLCCLLNVNESAISSAMGAIREEGRLRSLVATGVRCAGSVEAMAQLGCLLRALELRVSRVGNGGVLRICQSFPLLTVLRLPSVSASTACFPHIARHLPNLEELDFSHNNLSQLRVDALHPLQRLRRLKIVGASIGTSDVRAITRWPDLEQLRVSKFRNDEDMAILGQFPRLVDLQCGGFETPRGYELLGRLATVRVLSLWWHGAECEGHEQTVLVEGALARMGAIEQLTLSPGIFTYERLPSLAALTRLERLNLNGLRIEDSSLSQLPDLGTVRRLTFYYCPLSDLLVAALRQLATKGTLRAIDVWGATGLTEAGMDQLRNVGQGVVVSLKGLY